MAELITVIFRSALSGDQIGDVAHVLPTCILSHAMRVAGVNVMHYQAVVHDTNVLHPPLLFFTTEVSALVDDTKEITLSLVHLPSRLTVHWFVTSRAHFSSGGVDWVEVVPDTVIGFDKDPTTDVALRILRESLPEENSISRMLKIALARSRIPIERLDMHQSLVWSRSHGWVLNAIIAVRKEGGVEVEFDCSECILIKESGVVKNGANEHFLNATRRLFARCLYH